MMLDVDQIELMKCVFCELIRSDGALKDASRQSTKVKLL